MTDKITIELKETSFHRHPCTVCGGTTEKNPVIAESNNVIVCEGCLQNPAQIDWLLEEHATDLGYRAVWLRSLIGRLEIPPYEAWEKACDEHNRAVEAEYESSKSSFLRAVESSEDFPF